MSSTESVIKSDRFNHPEVAKSRFPVFKNLLQIRTPLKRDMTFTPPHKKNTSLSSNGIFYLLDINKYSLIQQRDVTQPNTLPSQGDIWIHFSVLNQSDPNVKWASSLTGLLAILGWGLVCTKKVWVNINETEHKSLASERAPAARGWLHPELCE